MIHKLALLLFTLMTMLVAAAQTQWQELRDWRFRKDADTEWQAVTVPHSCNANDGQSARYYRGLTHYTTMVRRTNTPQFLYVMGAAQRSVVMVNGVKLAEHRGGYTPYCVELTKALHQGDNELTITCDNSLDRNMAPVSSDFNKNNGLHNSLYLISTGDAYIDYASMGYDGIHVTPTNVSHQRADITVNTIVCNASAKTKRLTALFTIRDKEGRAVARGTKKLTVSAKAHTPVAWHYEMHNPHLWNGLSDPYLYTVELQLKDGRNILETRQVRTGLRSYKLDPERGFMLNGQSYPLRGFSMHQDWQNSASAVTAEQTDRDFEIIRELGMNVVRLAHYPHNRYILQKCDEQGLIVQTEIPWVNECGNDTTLYDQRLYTDNLHLQLTEMIQNHYNHPSIVFWGLWNELGNIDGSHPQGRSLDREAVLRTTASLYHLAHRLDSTRSVGFADASFGMRTPELREGEHFDYFAFNTYNGWYQNTQSPEGATNFATTLQRLHSRAPITAITEYGSGANPYCHSLNPAQTTKPSVGGARHDEEWANIVHERHLQALEAAPWLQFSTGWILFDFAVGARHEGYLLSDDQLHTRTDSAYMFLNDKGIVSRDRTMKKDAFYLYKAKWNKQEPTLYITSRRFVTRPSDSITIKVYSNLHSLKLYRNGRLIQQLQSTGESTGVVWTFSPVAFEGKDDEYRVVGTDTSGREYEDRVRFATL